MGVQQRVRLPSDAKRHRHGQNLYVDDGFLAHPLATLTLNKSWKGSPPVFLCTGWELLADEDKFMARKLDNDGVTVVFEEYEAMPHCFAMILKRIPGARRCFQSWAEFIQAAVDDPESIGSKATMIKARTLEEIPLDLASISDFSPEDMRERVHTQVEAKLAPEAISKL
jgi:hypothetical protein